MPSLWCRYGRHRLRHEAPELTSIIEATRDGAELALIALSLPAVFAAWGAGAPLLRRGWREAVRDRYAALAQPG
jgi:hypothetical protein